MNGPDLNNLRQILDEYERFAGAIPQGDPRTPAVEALRAALAEARALLHPSPDSTANFIDTRQMIERLNALRARAEKVG
jgi:hypothetical protein